MKKLKSIVILFILLVIRVNINYATVSGNYTVSKTKSNGKVLFLLIGFVLIGMVLFLGYKMDKLEETNNRKKKYKKDEDNKIKEKLLSFKGIIINFINKQKEKKQYEPETFVYDELENKDETEDTLESRDIIEYDDDDLPNNGDLYEEPKIQNKELDMISNIFNKADNEDEIDIKVKGYDYGSDDDFDLLDLEASIKEANIKKYTRKKKEKKSKNATKRYTRKIVKDQSEEINNSSVEEDIKERKPKRYTRKIISEEFEINNTETKKVESILKEEENIEKSISMEENTDNTDDVDFLNKIIDLGILKDIDELDKKRMHNKTNNGENEVHDSGVLNKEKKLEDKTKESTEVKIAKSRRGRKPKDVKIENDEKKSSKKDSTKVSKTKKENKTNEKKKTKKNNKENTPEVKRGRKPKIITEEEELRQVIEMLPKSRRGRKPKK